MNITRKSILTGTVSTREIDVTRDQIVAWERGELIQDAMPHLFPDDREFLMTGITPEQWETLTEVDLASRSNTLIRRGGSANTISTREENEDHDEGDDEYV